MKKGLKLTLGRLMPGLIQVRGRPSASGTPRLALTFDDGPHPDNTPRLLDCFREYGVACTFFVIGDLAERYPELIRRMAEEGHEVANHSFTHYGLNKLNEKDYRNDMLRGQAAIDQILGSVPKVLRPPYGVLRASTTLRLLGAGHRHVLWSVDSGDCNLQHGESLAERVAELDMVDGDIVLMHDDYEHTAAEMPRILANLRQRGFELVRCRDLQQV